MKWFRFPRALGVVLVLYFLAVTAFFGYQTTQRIYFIANAASVPGTVVGLEPRPIAGSTRTITGQNMPVAPQVRYVVGGKVYTISATHGTLGSRVRIGDQVTVLYDREEPDRARLEGEGRVLLPLITAGFGTLTVVLVIVLIVTRNLGTPPSTATGARPRPEAVETRTG